MRRVALFLAASAVVVSAAGSWAQQADSLASTNNPPEVSQSVPPLIMFSGAVKDLTGKPLTGPVDFNFAIYREQADAAPLWQESQTLNVDEQGHYTALLGAMRPEGLPVDLFTSGEARWLGVSVANPSASSGQVLPEQPRVLLVSVPYALKANDAEMLAGKPASAYALAQPALSSLLGKEGSGVADRLHGELATPGKGKSGPKPNVTGTGTLNYIPRWTDSAGTLGNSVIFQSGNNIGFGTTTPGYRLDVVGGSARVTNPSGTTQLVVSGSASSGRLGQDAAGFFFSSDTNAGALRFLTNNGSLHEWMRVTSGGNVGVGTTAPAQRLDVSGNLKITGAGNAIIFPDGTVQSTAGSGSGGGTVTAVTAGTGLAGGGTGGNVTLSLANSSCTAGSALTGLPLTCQPFATLGANTFTGNQSITGNLSATGTLSGGGETLTGGLSGTTAAFSGTGSFGGVLTASGGAVLPALGTATSSGGLNSNPLNLTASAFNSNVASAFGKLFQWQAEPVGNNTPTPSAQLNLLFSPNAGSATPSETGLWINADGTINFATGQAFPSSVGTITGVTAGTDLTGGGTSSVVTLNLDTTKVPTLGAASNVFTGSLAASAFSGDGTNLSNVNAAELGGLLPGAFQAAGAYAVTTGSNTFTADQTLNAALNLAQTTGADVGVINLGGSSLIHVCCPNSTRNTFVGTGAGNFTADATGSFGYGQNTATGFQALQALTSGYGNAATGYKALYSDTSGSDNAAHGDEALLFNSTGQDNTANGGLAMQYNTSGSSNTAVGFDALNKNCYEVAGSCTGNYNTALGYYAGVTSTGANANVTGANNTFLGAKSGPGTATQLSNATAIGANAVVSASNALVLGSINGVNGATASVNVGIGTATPAATLEVNGTAQFDGAVTFASADTFTGNQTVTGNVSASGQLISSVATGTAPLSVASTTLVPNLNADLLDGLHASAFQPAGSYATLGANTFTATQTISSGDVSLTSGDLDLPQTTGASTGVINLGGNPFLHACCAPGQYNTFLGKNAGSTSVTGAFDTALGAGALSGVTGGSNNTAVGYTALTSDTTSGFNAALGYGALHSATGSENTAVGSQAGYLVTTGSGNTFVGSAAGDNPITGNSNTGLGGYALYYLTSGASNIAIGYGSGENLDTGSNNIDIGSAGMSTDAKTIRIGVQGTQTATYIAGIRAVTTGQNNAVAVLIDSNGQLGTVSSSRRYKEDIRDMGEASDGLLRLRPVTFRYKKPYDDGSKPVQYGLIAEEVNEVYPDLVAFNKDGQPETVQYYKLDAMLLNEVQKLAKEHAADQAEIERLQSQIAEEQNARQAQQAELAQVLAQVREIQARLVGKSATRPRIRAAKNGAAPACLRSDTRNSKKPADRT